jgi:hypothetical protein
MSIVLDLVAGDRDSVPDRGYVLRIQTEPMSPKDRTYVFLMSI